MHDTLLPECKQMFARLDEKLDNLITRADRINGRYEKHMEESVLYRRFVDRHEQKIAHMEKEAEKAMSEKWNTAKASQWRVALIVGAVFSLTNLIMLAILRFAR